VSPGARGASQDFPDDMGPCNISPRRRGHRGQRQVRENEAGRGPL